MWRCDAEHETNKANKFKMGFQLVEEIQINQNRTTAEANNTEKKAKANEMTQIQKQWQDIPLHS